MWGNRSYTTDLILVIVDYLNSEKERRGLSCPRSRINNFHAASGCIYPAREEVQCDFYAVHSLRFVVHTRLAPEIFITGIVLCTLFASALGAIIHAKQIQDLL